MFYIQYHLYHNTVLIYVNNINLNNSNYFTSISGIARANLNKAPVYPSFIIAKYYIYKSIIFF